MRSITRISALTFVALSAATAGVEGGLRVVEQAVPATLEAGSENSLKVVIVNDGPEAWIPASGYALSYHWRDADDSIVVWDGRRSALPGPVEAGVGTEMVAVVEAPRAPGRYLLDWDIVEEGVRWLSETAPGHPEPVAVTVVAGHAFSLLAGSAPRIMVAGSTATVELLMRNDGRRTWRADGSFAAAAHWLSGESVRADGRGIHWEGRRTRFPVPVVQGETIELGVVVEAPRDAGLWRLQWDLVEEGVCWFSERSAGPPPAMRVLIVPDPLGHGLWWSLLVLTAAAAAVAVWHGGRSGAMAGFFAVADVLWCVGAVSIKQGAVLAEATFRPTAAGWLLVVGGASLLALPVFALPERFRGWAWWVVAAALTCVLWADSVYIRFFGDLPATAALAGAAQVGRVEASVRELIAPADLWLWLDLLPGLVLVLVAAHLRRRTGRRPTRLVITGLLLAITLGAAAAVRLAVVNPSLLGQVFRRVAVAEQIGVVNLHAVDAARSLADRVVRPELGRDRFEDVVSWFRATARERGANGPWFAVAEGANLIMVQVESLQGFVIGLEIGGREVTPFLNRWTDEALWFSNLSDQTGQGRSSDSELATQVSLLPMVGGAAAFRFADNDFTGLAEALAGRGYETLSAVPYEGSFWNRRRTHPAYGFATSLFVKDFSAGERVGWGLSDRDFLDQAARGLAALDRPFAAYLLTLSLHHPFEGFPAHLEVLDVGDWQGTDFGSFLHTMHFFDQSLAAFVATLEREGLAEDTVIAIWGDHDAGFPWRPEIAAAMGVSHDPAGWYLSQEVPLFIRVSGDDALRGERTMPAGHADIAPTLLALLGVDPAPYAFVGRNLLGEPGDRPVVGEYGCWRDATHLFLQGAGSLDDGTCIETATMRAVSPGECGEAYRAARRAEEVSALVLEHDLQRAIHRELLGEREPLQ